MSLAAKLAKITGQIHAIPKRGHNDFHKYDYVMEGDLVAAIRPLLAAEGIVIIPSLVSEEWERDSIQERNGTSSLTRIVMRYTVTDGIETYQFDIPGHGVDRADKGVYKAMTGSMKYALMKLFQVETGDDPERNAPSDEPPAVTVNVFGSNEEGIEKGGRSKTATRFQLQRISATMRDRNLGRPILLGLIDELFGVELQLPEDDPAPVILAYLRALPSDDAGQLIAALEAAEQEIDASP